MCSRPSARKCRHKQCTRQGYEDRIEHVLTPSLGHLKMRHLHARRIQEMQQAHLGGIWADNKVHQANREAAQQALAVERAALSTALQDSV